MLRAWLPSMAELAVAMAVGYQAAKLRASHALTSMDRDHKAQRW